MSSSFVRVSPSVVHGDATDVHAVSQAVMRAWNSLESALSDTAGMAGDDEGAEQWGLNYDANAPLMNDGALTIVQALGNFEQLLTFSASGYDTARMVGADLGASSAYPTPPLPTFNPGEVPLCIGTGWDNFAGDVAEVLEGLIAGIGIVFPRGDTNKLRRAADDWDTFADDLGTTKSSLESALSGVNSLELPEISQINNSADKIGTMLSSYKDAARTQARELRGIAEDIEQALEDLKEMLISLAIEVAIEIAISAALSLVTFGVGAAVGAASIALKVGSFAFRWAARIRSLATKLRLAGNTLQRVNTVLQRLKHGSFVWRAGGEAAVSAASSITAGFVNAARTGQELSGQDVMGMVFGGIAGGAAGGSITAGLAGKFGDGLVGTVIRDGASGVGEGVASEVASTLAEGEAVTWDAIFAAGVTGGLGGAALGGALHGAGSLGSGLGNAITGGPSANGGVGTVPQGGDIDFAVANQGGGGGGGGTGGGSGGGGVNNPTVNVPTGGGSGAAGANGGGGVNTPTINTPTGLDGAGSPEIPAAPPIADVDVPPASPIADYDVPPASPIADYDVPPASPIADYDVPPASPIADYDVQPASPIADYDVPPASPISDLTPGAETSAPEVSPVAGAGVPVAASPVVGIPDIDLAGGQSNFADALNTEIAASNAAGKGEDPTVDPESTVDPDPTTDPDVTPGEEVTPETDATTDPEATPEDDIAPVVEVTPTVDPDPAADPNQPWPDAENVDPDALPNQPQWDSSELDANSDITHGTRFFGAEQLRYFVVTDANHDPVLDANGNMQWLPGARLGGGGPLFMAAQPDVAGIGDPVEVAIQTGLPGSVTNAAMRGEPVFGISIPLDGIPVRLPTAADAGTNPNFVLGGFTAVRIGDEFFLNPTREFVADTGAIPLPPGTTLFRLLPDGTWDVLALFT